MSSYNTRSLQLQIFAKAKMLRASDKGRFEMGSVNSSLLKWSTNWPKVSSRHYSYNKTNQMH